MKFLRKTLVSLFVIYFALWGVTLVIHYPAPYQAIKLGLAPASKTPTLMPAHTIAASTRPMTLTRAAEPMPSSVDWNGKQISWQEFLDTSHTNVFLVLRNGAGKFFSRNSFGQFSKWTFSRGVDRFWSY